MFAAHQLGGAAAALAAGVVRDAFGDYRTVFVSAGLLCLLAAGLVLRIRAAGVGTDLAVGRAAPITA